MAGACVLAMGMHWLSWRAAYFVALVVAFCGLLVTGHFGGSLTHGQDYLTHYLPAFERQLRGGASAAQPVSPAGSALRRPAFASMVQPVMAAKCVACHGPNKAKAGLRLDTLEAILKGRRSGPVVIPGQSAASSFIKCLVSPPQQDEHMPPDGKPQLTPDEIAMLRWWIDAGAPGNKTPAELKLPAHLQYLITAVLAPAKPAATPNPKP